MGQSVSEYGVVSRTQAERANLWAHVSKNVGRAVCDYQMIQDGDRILVAVSGGKDSLTMFKVLKDRQAFVPIGYELVPVYVDLGCSSFEGVKVLRSYFAGLGSELLVRQGRVVSKEPDRGLTCFWCSWSRRKLLFETAESLKCTKIALGHHKDDIVETILMNMFFEGQVSAMCPHQKIFGGTLSIIRPLAYIEEAKIRELAAHAVFPAFQCVCSQSGRTRRAAMKKMLSGLEKEIPTVKTNIFRSLKRIKNDYLL